MFTKIFPSIFIAILAGIVAAQSVGANESVAGDDDPFAENTPMVAAATHAPAAAAEKCNPSNEEDIRRALAEPTKMDFTETPLADVIDYLRDLQKAKHPGFEIQLDNKILTDLGVTADTPITKHIQGVTLRSALRLMLRDMGMAFVIRDEVLLITSPEEAEMAVVRKVYDVSELISPADREKGNAFASLVDMVAKTAKVDNAEQRGPGCWISTINSSEIAVITISQTEDIHEEVAKLLADLHAAKHR
jgi:hypothetical protein